MEMIRERLEAELGLLREFYPDVEYTEESGRWIRIPSYPLPEGWGRGETPVAFDVKDVYPATPPYGIYVPADLAFGVQPPKNANPNPPQPPFGGAWILLSWTVGDGDWRPTGDVRTGSNLAQWARGFSKRFSEGQ